MKKTILIALLTLLPLTATAEEIDNILKKQCQYEVYGNGEKDFLTGSYMLGIVSGIDYITSKKDKTIFANKSSYTIISSKACQNALNNISSNGFLNDFRWQATKLISTEYN